LTDLVSGQVQVMFSSLPGAMPLIRANRIRADCSLYKDARRIYPQYTAVIESGVAGYDVEYWFGIFVPTATGKDIVMRLHEEIVQSLKQSNRNQ
jgi:tripartite-type tricarboxylate transporter receptor subunit TctC